MGVWQEKLPADYLVGYEINLGFCRHMGRGERGMKEIKFRYGYTDGENWIFGIFTLDQIEGGDQFDFISDSPLLKDYRIKTRDQYVGKSDDGLDDIYEGDILENGNGIHLKVYWNEWECMFKQKVFDRGNVESKGYVYNEDNPTDVSLNLNWQKIIGNIHSGLL
jgi:hypothetical protein